MSLEGGREGGRRGGREGGRDGGREGGICLTFIKSTSSLCLLPL